MKKDPALIFLQHFFNIVRERFDGCFPALCFDAVGTKDSWCYDSMADLRTVWSPILTPPRPDEFVDHGALVADLSVEFSAPQREDLPPFVPEGLAPDLFDLGNEAWLVGHLCSIYPHPDRVRDLVADYVRHITTIYASMSPVYRDSHTLSILMDSSRVEQVIRQHIPLEGPNSYSWNGLSTFSGFDTTTPATSYTLEHDGTISFALESMSEDTDILAMKSYHTGYQALKNPDQSPPLTSAFPRALWAFHRGHLQEDILKVSFKDYVRDLLNLLLSLKGTASTPVTSRLEITINGSDLVGPSNLLEAIAEEILTEQCLFVLNTQELGGYLNRKYEAMIWGLHRSMPLREEIAEVEHLLSIMLFEMMVNNFLLFGKDRGLPNPILQRFRREGFLTPFLIHEGAIVLPSVDDSEGFIRYLFDYKAKIATLEQNPFNLVHASRFFSDLANDRNLTDQTKRRLFLLKVLILFYKV